MQLAGTSKKRALDLGKQALDVGKKKAKLVSKQALDLGKQKVKEFGQKAVKEFENKLNKKPTAVVQEIFGKPTPAKRKRVVLKRPAPAPVLKRPAPVLSVHAPEPVVNRPETSPGLLLFLLLEAGDINPAKVTAKQSAEDLQGDEHD